MVFAMIAGLPAQLMIHAPTVSQPRHVSKVARLRSIAGTLHQSPKLGRKRREFGGPSILGTNDGVTMSRLVTAGLRTSTAYMEAISAMERPTAVPPKPTRMPP